MKGGKTPAAREALLAEQWIIAVGDPGAIVIGTPALKRLPQAANRKFPLGKYHGLTFGIEYRWKNSQIYLTGEAELTVSLSKESRGARAVLNALNSRASWQVGYSCSERRETLSFLE